jgi:endo-1,4-beta-xylanase
LVLGPECSVQTYAWTGFVTLHTYQPSYVTNISIPAPVSGETLRVRSIDYTAFDGNSPGATPSRADDDEANERFGIRIGNTDVTALSQDLPDTVAEGATNDNYSGVHGGRLTGWSGRSIVGGLVQLRHASLYGFIDASSNSLLAYSFTIEIERCGGASGGGATTTTMASTSTTAATSTTVGSGSTTTDPTATTVQATTTTTTGPAYVGPTLRAAGTQKNVITGAAVDGYQLFNNPAYAAAVITHFNSITPENAMKLDVIRHNRNVWDYSEADALVAFAQTNGLLIRGTTLVWGQQFSDGVPAWMETITDPVEFETEYLNSISTIMQHFAGDVDRWDVVNEPFEYATGTLDQNIFYEHFGADYIPLAFETAHAADPNAELWLNETNTEYVPAKADALVLLVEQMLADGVHIDGVGLQTHLSYGDPGAGKIKILVGRLRALGVKVAITEIDVPIGPLRTAAQAAQLYGNVASELLSEGGSEITFWGVSDNLTWLDYEFLRATNPSLWAWDLPSRPLVLDTNYSPKSSYANVVNEILNH